MHYLLDGTAAAVPSPAAAHGADGPGAWHDSVHAYIHTCNTTRLHVVLDLIVRLRNRTRSNKQTDRQTGRQTDRQTDRQADIQTYVHT